VFSDYSDAEGDDLIDDIDDKQLAKDQKKTIVDKINVEEEEDLDEDFLFS
jgi:hypothetical protein